MKDDAQVQIVVPSPRSLGMPYFSYLLACLQDLDFWRIGPPAVVLYVFTFLDQVFKRDVGIRDAIALSGLPLIATIGYFIIALVILIVIRRSSWLTQYSFSTSSFSASRKAEVLSLSNIADLRMTSSGRFLTLIYEKRSCNGTPRDVKYDIYQPTEALTDFLKRSLVSVPNSGTKKLKFTLLEKIESISVFLIGLYLLFSQAVFLAALEGKNEKYLFFGKELEQNALLVFNGLCFLVFIILGISMVRKADRVKRRPR
jgi:hypothetical protein